MIAKRDVGTFLFGVLVGLSGIKFATHALYWAIIAGLVIAIYFK